MKPFQTCLWFDTEAEAAAEFYVSVFPDSKITQIEHYPEGSSASGKVLTVDFVLNGQQFIGLNGGPEFTFDEAVSVTVPCADQAEIDHYWHALGDTGQFSQCGWLKDKYGMSWQIVPEQTPELLGGDGTPESRSRVFAALMKMSKIDIAALEAAR